MGLKFVLHILIVDTSLYGAVGVLGAFVELFHGAKAVIPESKKAKVL